MQFRGHRPVCAKGLMRGVLMSTSRETSTPTRLEWGREIDQTLFPGGYFKEFVFFHKTSRRRYSPIPSSTSSLIR